MVKSRLKKSAPECPFECGGGVQLLFGQCPNRGGDKLKGASLMRNCPIPILMLDGIGQVGMSGRQVLQVHVEIILQWSISLSVLISALS